MAEQKIQSTYMTAYYRTPSNTLDRTDGVQICPGDGTPILGQT